MPHPTPSLAATLVLLFAAAAAAEPAHYVFFGQERARIAEPSFLENPGFAGAQLKYSWRELEPERGRYAFAPLLADLAALERAGKRLFVQIQDVSFSEDLPVPDYLLQDPAFGGGAARKYDQPGGTATQREPTAGFDGWVARRWDPAVRARFAALLEALGRAVDGRVAGINLAETAVDFLPAPERTPPGFDPGTYRAGVLANLDAARRAFPRSVVLVYANFMPGEWLPDEDAGHLRAVHAHAARIGAGVGVPDLRPFHRGYRRHAYPLIAGRAAGVPAGAAVQDDNLVDLDPATGRAATVEDLIRFATDELRLDYVFWGTQEPYYTGAIVPALRARAAAEPPTLKSPPPPPTRRPTR